MFEDELDRRFSAHHEAIVTVRVRHSQRVFDLPYNITRDAYNRS